MRRWTRLLTLEIAAVAMLTTALGGTVAADTGPTTPAAPRPGDVKQPAYVEVHAAQGTLTSGPAGASQLTLTGVDGSAALFTDKPQASAGSIQINDLLDDWTKNGFASNPPNAALVVVGGAGAGTASTLKLSNPQHSGTTITFTVQPASIQGNSNVVSPIQQAAKTATGPAPASFGSAALFIDPLQDFMHYCYAGIRNESHQTLVSAGVLLLSPQYFPKGVIKPGDTTHAASLGPLICNINYGFTGGGFNIGLTMVNPKGEDNIVKCGVAGRGHCIVTVTHDTATFNVDVRITD